MLSTLSMWLLYLSSWGVAYILFGIEIVVSGVMGKQSTCISTWEKITTVIGEHTVILIVLFAMAVFSIIYTITISKWKNNCRIHIKVEKNITIETTGMFASYLLPLVMCAINLYVGIITLITLLIIGIAIVNGGYLHTCTIFLLKGYRVFQSDKIIILTKMRMEKFNISVEDEPEGLEARQIYRNLYIVCSR